MSELSSDEFALSNGASLQIDRSKAQMKFTQKDGQVTMHISMPVIPDDSKIQVGPGTIRFFSCAVHKFDSPNFNTGAFNDVFVRLVPGQPEVVLQSLSADFTLITNGDKREHGSESLLQKVLLNLEKAGPVKKG